MPPSIKITKAMIIIRVKSVFFIILLKNNRLRGFPCKRLLWFYLTNLSKITETMVITKKIPTITDVRFWILASLVFEAFLPKKESLLPPPIAELMPLFLVLVNKTTKMIARLATTKSIPKII